MADTAVTVQTIIDNSIARAKDTFKTQWTDAQLLKFLNKAYSFVYGLLIKEQSELVKTSVPVTMVAGTQEYSLATNLPDFWQMVENGVYFSAVKVPMTPVSVEDKIRAGSTTTTTNPTAYYVTDTSIGVIPVPSATSVASYPTLTCRYYKANAALSLTDNMPFKNLFNEPMSYFMDHVALIKTEHMTEEITNLYNALEQATLEIAKKRTPL